MKKAFTLAEVLITLMIIGIVAALTIPSVISNYQQQEFKTGLKKAVSVLNEAIQTNIAQDGETPYDVKERETKNSLSYYLSRHMSVIKGPKYLSGNFVFYTTDGFQYSIPEFSEISENIKLYESNLNPGSDFQEIRNGSPTIMCGSYGLKNNQNKTITAPCVILVDVNGDKKPNPKYELWENGDILSVEYRFPKPSDKKLQDVFAILITEDRAIPFGVVAQRAMYGK